MAYLTTQASEVDKKDVDEGILTQADVLRSLNFKRLETEDIKDVSEGFCHYHVMLLTPC